MILIIEPSKTLARVIEQALAAESIPCELTRSSEQAIAAAENKDLRAVVIELLMPGHNGLEFIYEFRSYEDWLDIPIIIYSQLSGEELGLTNTLKREMGIQAHLYKPTSSLKDLVQEVQRAIRT